MFGWAKAMYDFFNVFTNTKPLRDKLNEMVEKVEEMDKELKLK